MSKPRMVVFSGHRNVPTGDADRIRAAVRDVLKDADVFYCGGAVGADIVALGEAVRVKRAGAALTIRVIVVNTLKEQPHHARQCIGMVLKEIELEELGFPYCADALLFRTRLLVDKARIYPDGKLLVYWDGRPASGTFAAVCHARRVKVPFTNCHPNGDVALLDEEDRDLHLSLDNLVETDPETENPKP